MTEKTIVTVATKDMQHFEVDADNMAPLEKAVLGKLKALKVSKVTADIAAGGKAVKFTLEAPAAVDPGAVKKALK